MPRTFPVKVMILTSANKKMIASTKADSVDKKETLAHGRQEQQWKKATRNAFCWNMWPKNEFDKKRNNKTERVLSMISWPVCDTPFVKNLVTKNLNCMKKVDCNAETIGFLFEGNIQEKLYCTGWFLISVPCFGIYKSIVLRSNRPQILDT